MSEARGKAARGSLGAGDGPIEIASYEPAWRDAYLAERRRLARWLPGLEIRHIGSTSVPGLAAKRVIDMIALVDDLDATTEQIVQGPGYHLPVAFNEGLIHRRYLCYPSVSHRTHHLHLVDAREELDQCLRFRDMLARDPQLAEEYVALKRSLAVRFREDRAGYTTAKGEFIMGALMDPSRL
jgi:GrpB-like predicted nucleotidyltransferase (UPF0157 family)